MANAELQGSCVNCSAENLAWGIQRLEVGCAERSTWLLPCPTLTEGSTSPVPQQLLCPAGVKSGLSFSNLKLSFSSLPSLAPLSLPGCYSSCGPSSLLPPPDSKNRSDCQGGSMVNTQLALYKLPRATCCAQPPWSFSFVAPAGGCSSSLSPDWLVLTMATCWQVLWAYRSYLIVLCLPIFLLPLPIIVRTKVRTVGLTQHR